MLRFVLVRHLVFCHFVNARNMTGIEFTLLHAQEPILYIVRKQNRHGPNHGWLNFSNDSGAVFSPCVFTCRFVLVFSIGMYGWGSS